MTGVRSQFFEFTEATPGRYVINVTVSDGYMEISHEWTVTVRTSPVEAAALSPWLIGGVLGAAVAGIAVALAWGWIRSKKKGPGKFDR